MRIAYSPAVFAAHNPVFGCNRRAEDAERLRLNEEAAIRAEMDELAQLFGDAQAGVQLFFMLLAPQRVDALDDSAKGALLQAGGRIYEALHDIHQQLGVLVKDELVRHDGQYPRPVLPFYEDDRRLAGLGDRAAIVLFSDRLVDTLREVRDYLNPVVVEQWDPMMLHALVSSLDGTVAFTLPMGLQIKALQRLKMDEAAQRYRAVKQNGRP